MLSIGIINFKKNIFLLKDSFSRHFLIIEFSPSGVTHVVPCMCTSVCYYLQVIKSFGPNLLGQNIIFGIF